jgi:PAS domain S-box-containing protein
MPLINTETVLHNFINLDPRPYFVLNLNTRTFEYTNPAFCKYFQLKPGSIKADKLLKMLDKEERNRFEKSLCALTAGEPHSTEECKMTFPDGTERYLILHIVIEKQAEQSYLTGYLKDITEVKANEAKLSALAAERDKQRRTLKHDLSGTLGFIPTFTTLLLKKTEGIEDKQVPVLISSIESISKETLSKIKDYMNEEPS